MCAASVGVISEVIHNFPVLHPIDNYLMWVGRSAEASDDVRMLQSYPEGDLLVERLTIVVCIRGPVWKGCECLTFSLSFRPFSPSLTVTLIDLRDTCLRFMFFSTSSPLHTSAKPPEANFFSSFLETPSEMTYDLGSTPRLPQVFHRAYKAF